MHYRTLGRSGLEVSLLSFGTGGPTTFTEAELSDADKTRLLRRCLDHGITLIDTSQGYGDSELFLGAALAGVPRDRYLLSTKWAYSRWTGPDSDPQEGEPIGDPGAFEQAVDASLGRLRTDHVDVMFIHGLKPDDYDAVYERHGPAIERLKQAGKIRLAGFSERMGDDLEHRVTIDAISRHPSFWDVSMLRYGILNQCARDRALPLAAEHGVAVMNMSPARYLLPHPEQLVERIAAWKADGSLAPDAVADDDSPRLARSRRGRVGGGRRHEVRGRPSRRLHRADRHPQLRAPGGQHPGAGGTPPAGRRSRPPGPAVQLRPRVAVMPAGGRSALSGARR